MSFSSRYENNVLHSTPTRYTKRNVRICFIMFLYVSFDSHLITRFILFKYINNFCKYAVLFTYIDTAPDYDFADPFHINIFRLLPYAALQVGSLTRKYLKNSQNTDTL